MSAAEPQVIIFGSEEDDHIQFLVPRLRRPYTIVNVARLEDGLSFGFDRNKTPALDVTHAGRQLDLSPGAVASVWYRRGTLDYLRPRFTINPPEHHDYAVSSMRQLTANLPGVLPQEVLWVSHPQDIAWAEHKVGQIATANQLGFKVPTTLATSDHRQAQEFVRIHKAVIIKTLSRVMPPGLNQYTILREGTEIDFRGLSMSPQIFQQLIPKKEEVRVAVIGHRVYGSVVGDADEASAQQMGIRDFRHGLNKKDAFFTAPKAVPQAVTDRCVAYVQKRHLYCGFFDFVVDPDGVW